MALKVLGVSGSMRASSHGLTALKIILEAAREFGADARLLDLRTADLPMYNPDQPDTDDRIKRVLEDVSWAEAFVLATPDYHGAMSGAMKNFLDYHWSEFSGKLFAYACASHEKGITAMEQMRIAVRQCYGWSLPYGAAVHGEKDFDSSGVITNPRVTSRLRMIGRDVTIYGQMLYKQFLEDIAMKTPETYASRYG